MKDDQDPSVQRAKPDAQNSRFLKYLRRIYRFPQRRAYTYRVVLALIAIIVASLVVEERVNVTSFALMLALFSLTATTLYEILPPRVYYEIIRPAGLEPDFLRRRVGFAVYLAIFISLSIGVVLQLRTEGDLNLFLVFIASLIAVVSLDLAAWALAWSYAEEASKKSLESLEKQVGNLKQTLAELAQQQEPTTERQEALKQAQRDAEDLEGALNDAEQRFYDTLNRTRDMLKCCQTQIELLQDNSSTPPNEDDDSEGDDSQSRC